jgi:hypothetical protein
MIELRYGSAELSDDVFVAEFESCRFPNNRFRHADHIRLAWIYVRLCGYERAEQSMRTSILRFACHLGAVHKYHETITILWMRLVNIASHLSGRKEKFDDFARGHGWLFNKDTVFEFYSRELLMSDTARKVWVEPDLKPIPTLQKCG